MNDLGLLAARLMVGGAIAAHGAQKAFGAFDGPGPRATAGFMERLGFRPGESFARAAWTAELGGGALIALGLGGPAGPAAIIATMIVAQASVHAPKGFFNEDGGIELGTIYGAAALALASSGYGRLSLDAVGGWRTRFDGRASTLAVAGAILAGIVVLAQREPPDDAPANDQRRVAATVADSLHTAQLHIAAAQEDRPVPADLLEPTAESVDTAR